MTRTRKAPQVVNIHEAKTHLSRLLERVRQGEEIVLAKAGTPIARLVPVERMRPEREPGLLKQLGLDIEMGDDFFEPLPEEELRAWEGEGDRDPI